MILRGVDTELAVGERLEFRWDGGSLSLTPEACVSVYAGSYGRGGDLDLVFRFRPTESPVNAAGRVGVRMLVAAEQAERAWQLVQVLVGVYGIEDVAWTDGRKVVCEQRFRIPADGTEWLNAPASPRTEALLTSVTRRLIGQADG